jgi:hypothetical protein
MARKTTRRQLMTRGITTTAAAPLLIRSGLAEAATTPPESDSAVLVRTFRVERVVAIAYGAVLATDVLKPTVRRQLDEMLSQELEHISTLRHALDALATPLPAVDLAAAQHLLTDRHVHLSLTHLTTQHECLKLLIDVESLAEGAYFSAISKLSDSSLLRLCTEVTGCEAQHWTVLSALQHHNDVTRSVPYAFVQGSP